MFRKKYRIVITKIFSIIKISSLTILTVFSTQCSKMEEIPPVPTGQTKSYTIRNTDLSDITGTVTFIENDNNTTTIDLKLINTISNVDNVIYLRRGTANIGGGLAAILNPLNGSTGISNTTIATLNDGQKITYGQLIDFEGYIDIGLTNQNTGEIAAYCDIGPNEFTGKKVSYALLSPLDESQNGLAIFEERKKGTSAITINIFDFEPNGIYPVNIKNADTNATTTDLIELPPVKGKSKGNSFSELTEISGVVITYEQLLQLNATIEVNSSLSPSTVVSAGGIGSNPKALINYID